MDVDDLRATVNCIAAQHGLDPCLALAIAEQESGWRPWAHKYEPGYRWLWPSRSEMYCPRGVTRSTELVAQMTSWGLMQVMGAVAREHGFRAAFLAELCDPATGAEYGCRLLAHLLSRWPRVEDAVSSYNAGHPTWEQPEGNAEYVRSVMARVTRLRGELSV